MRTTPCGLVLLKAHLGIARSIRIVEYGHRTSSRFLEQLLRLTPKPFLGHIPPYAPYHPG